jgi:hypothetical protein
LQNAPRRGAFFVFRKPVPGFFRGWSDEAVGVQDRQPGPSGGPGQVAVRGGAIRPGRAEHSKDCRPFAFSIDLPLFNRQSCRKINQHQAAVDIQLVFR